MQNPEPVLPRTRKARPSAQTPEQPKSKKDQLVTLLRNKSGADVKQLGDALGWLPHTVRAALTGLRKSGVTIEKIASRDGEATKYRIANKRGRSA